MKFLVFQSTTSLPCLKILHGFVIKYKLLPESFAILSLRTLLDSSPLIPHTLTSLLCPNTNVYPCVCMCMYTHTHTHTHTRFEQIQSYETTCHSPRPLHSAKPLLTKAPFFTLPCELLFFKHCDFFFNIYFYLLIYLVVHGLSCGRWTPQLRLASSLVWHANSWLRHACGIWFPDQGSNPGPLHWEYKS